MFRKKSNKQKTKKSPQSFFLNAFAMFAVVSAIGVFRSRLVQNTDTLKVYAPKSGPYFLIYKYGSSYLHNVLEWLTQVFQTPNAFGWAVIALTVIVKFISLFNRMLVSKMSINANQRQIKLKPQLSYIDDVMLYVPINNKQSIKLKELRNDCLTANHASIKKWPYFANIILSMVVMTALYQSVAYSTNMHDIYFFSIDLSQRSIIMTLISSLLYGIANLISWHYLSETNRARTGAMNYFITPVTTFLSGYFLPSIITLYWVTSASCLIIQYICTYWFIDPLFKKQAMQKFKPKTIVTKEKIDAIINESS